MDSTFMAKQDFTTQELQLLSSEMENRKKSAGTSWLLLLFFGGFGAHRFYLGQPGVGIAMICTWLISWFMLFIPIAIWILVELFLLSGLIREANMRTEKEVIDKIVLMRQAKANDTNQRLQQHGAQSNGTDTVSLEK